ncbi:A-kinase anchor protein 11 isoform X2 [Megalops cyprinoides]|uniref:A-kinase anchor protein 11 isoform X2 n=1 Tax=Megalops cyprinoides TaxID=118141 RepID=UPI001863AF8F|nr:A-kinase anchor protein 11 isoform X2 [Megalops cyprinoides]
MDAFARIRGVPLKARGSIRKESLSESPALCLRTLARSRRELCNVVLEVQARDPACQAEIQFVCLPSQSEGDDFTLQALPSVPVDLLELLRSLHVHSLKDEEVLLLKDSKRFLEKKDSIPQATWSKAICILRHSHVSPSDTTAMLDLLSRYMAGFRYALELQSLQKSVPDACQAEDDDTNQSVSSIEDDFVTALEHLEEEEVADNPFTGPFNQRNQRDVASQTVRSHRRKKSGSRIIISSVAKGSSTKQASGPEVSVSVQSSAPAWSSRQGSQWSFFTPNSPPKGRVTSATLTESEESDCSSPSPIIFLDEVGYQKSLKAKLDIPKIPVLKDGVEDSDSEVSEFFDSFDQFDDLDQALESTNEPPKELASTGQTQKKKFSEDCDSKFVSRDSSARAMNPHRFDHPVLPANIKKPTPLKPGSPYSVLPDVPDSPRLVRTSCEESGALFSPVRSSAFSPLGDGPNLEYFWRPDGDGSELRKPQDLCALYKTYSDFANNMSKEILSSVCGYSSPTDMNVNKNLSCVCHKEFTNSSGHLMKLSDIQETVTISKSQKSQTLKEGIQRFATDLVEMSLGSAFRDLQKGVASCTTTLCHLAARLTSSVFQMAFHEIGMRHAYVLKERAINGLASFLVGEAVSGALKEFHFVKKQIFNNTVTRFAADLAEELVFEGIMEVCQFSHPSTPMTPSDWSFEQEEEVVCSYASDLSESVLQEAFIELSQADVTFTTQAAISVSLDNIHYVSAEDTTQTTRTCNTATSYLGLPCTAEPVHSEAENSCTVEKALFCMSGIASCIPVPVAGKGISQFQNSVDTCHYKSSICHTSQTSPKKSSSSEQSQVMTSASDTSATVQANIMPPVARSRGVHGEKYILGAAADFMPDENVSDAPSSEKTQNFSGSIVDTLVNESYKVMTGSNMKNTVEGCAGYEKKKIGNSISSSGRECTSKRTSVEGNSVRSTPTGPEPPSEKKPETHFELQDPAWQRLVSEDKCTKQKDSAYLRKRTEQTSLSFTKPPCNSGSKSPGADKFESDCRNVCLVRERTPVVHLPPMKDTLEVPSFEAVSRDCRKIVPEEMLSSTGRKCSGTPGTPPPTPQQPLPVSQEKQFKQFSKKLKGKLAKEFSPATPPSTPHYQSAGGLAETHADSDKADFMLKLMRSLSDEAGSNEDDQDSQEDGSGSGMAARDCHTELNLPLETEQKMIEKGALCYAGRLASHIVSMATEMDTLGLEDGLKVEDRESKGGPPMRSAQFSEQTLNSLWTYAGEIAGEVISDVKKMIGSSQCKHKAEKRGEDVDAVCHQHSDCRWTSMADQWSSNLLASVLSIQSSGSSGLSSEYPSCESVTDEYAGYLIRVLKREGGHRELILDQYASRLAYRSIRSGLAQAARRIKQRSNLRLDSFRRLHHDETCENYGGSIAQTTSEEDVGNVSSSLEAVHCTCQETKSLSKREYVELVTFAESLAYNIVCDVTRKLKFSSVRLPKSLTDSCLYRKPKVEDVPKNLSKSTCSCSSLPYTEKHKQYHSTSSLNDGNRSDGVMQVIEHYARKIVDDTLEMTLVSAGHWALDDARRMDRNSHTEKLSEVALRSGLADKTCRYCVIRERPFCSNACEHNFQEIHRKRRWDCEAMADSCCNRTRVCGFEIPKIHIDLEKRAAFAEEMVSSAIEKAKRELSNTSLNADSGIGHDGASFAESLATEIMTSAMSNICQTINVSPPGRERTYTSESTVSQQLSLSAGEDSLGSWSNLSFEDEHPDESSSFLHLSDSDGTEEKETETKEDIDGPLRAEAGLVVINTDLREQALDPQVRTVLQWIAASHSELPAVQLGRPTEQGLQQLPAVLWRVREREWKVGELLQALLRYCEEAEPELDGEEPHRKPFFQWLLEHA